MKKYQFKYEDDEMTCPAGKDSRPLVNETDAAESKKLVTVIRAAQPFLPDLFFIQLFFHLIICPTFFVNSFKTYFTTFN